jgi:hypothetical protein
MHFRVFFKLQARPFFLEDVLDHFFFFADFFFADFFFADFFFADFFFVERHPLVGTYLQLGDLSHFFVSFKLHARLFFLVDFDLDFFFDFDFADFFFAERHPLVDTNLQLGDRSHFFLVFKPHARLFFLVDFDFDFFFVVRLFVHIAVFLL